MHWLPDWACFDIFFLKRKPQGFAVCPKFLCIHQHDGKPAVRLAIGHFRHKAEAGQGAQMGAVIVVNCAAAGHALRQHFQLPHTNRRRDIAQTVIIPVRDMLVMRRRLARLLREFARFINQRLVITREHSAAACCDDFIAVERIAGRACAAPCRAAFIGRADRLCGIYHERYAIVIGKRTQGIKVAALAV